MANEKKNIPLIKITAKRDGFRRGGIEHPDRPVVHRADRFKKEQLAQIEGEPMLIVEKLEGPDPAAPAEEK